MVPSWASWRSAKKAPTPLKSSLPKVFDNYYLLRPDSEAARLRSNGDEESSASSTQGAPTTTQKPSSQFDRVKFSAYALEQDLKRRTLWERLTKRRVVLRFQVGLTIAVLFINIVWTIWASKTYGTQNGVGTIYIGDCGEAQLLNLYLHIVINVLSTLLLGTSNYCMQLISAPTREEIDRAHANKTWLDIGVPSARNVWKLNMSNKITWCGLAITSAMLHLFWNSAVFYTIPTYEYRVAVATSDFQDFNQSWPSKGGYEFDAFRKSATTLEYLNNTGCISRYIEPLNSAQDVIVVTKRTTAENSNQTLLTSEISGGLIWYFQEYWICSSPEIHSAMLPGGCTQEVLNNFLSNWTVATGDPAPTVVNSIGGGSVEVDHCLSAGVNDSQNQCSVGFSTYIMAIVIGMNALKCLFVIFVHWKSGKFSAIVTLGDAIASFLQEPDHHTEQMCLATKRTFMSTAAWGQQAIEWWPVKMRWINATTKRRFWITIGVYISTFITVTALLIAGIATRVRDHRSISIDALLTQGLGNPDPQELLSGKNSPSTLLAAVVTANVFQVLFSCLYYMYNSVLSCMLVALEWSNYSIHKKSLRVSNPTGAQRGSYFLTVPYRYGIPLLGVSSLLQWLVSQSIFLIQTVNYDPTRTNTVASGSNRIGFSPIGIIAAYGLTWLAFLTLILLAFVKVYPQGDKAMPMVSTCSAAISASCHRPPGDYDAWQLPVLWGVTPGRGGKYDKEVGHCSFTTARDVSRPVEGRLYA